MSLNLIPVMIAGVGYGVPDTVITNDDLTKLVDTSDEWITTKLQKMLWKRQKWMQKMLI